METARPRAVGRRRAGAPAPGTVFGEADSPLAGYALVPLLFVPQARLRLSRNRLDPHYSHSRVYNKFTCRLTTSQ